MSCEVEVIDLPIIQGATFRRTINWYGAGLLCKAIENLQVGCPTIITITDHGLPTTSRTPITVHDVKGAISVNTDAEVEDTLANVLTTDTFEVNRSTNNETWVEGTGSVSFHAPTDLTGYDARMQIRSTRGSNTLIHELTTGLGTITLNPVDGSIEMFISDTDTAAFDFSNAVYDLELIDTGGNGDVTRVAEGSITLHKEVTR